MGDGAEEEAALQRLQRWRKTRQPSASLPLALPLPPCSCQSSLPPSTSAPLRWLSGLRCLQRLRSSSASAELRALSRLPVLEALAALVECAALLEAGEATEGPLGLCCLHLLAVVAGQVREETAALLLTAADRVADHLCLSGGSDSDSDAAALLLLVHAQQLKGRCRAQSREVSAALAQPLPPLLPPTALPSHGDVATLLPPLASSPSLLRRRRRPSLWSVALTFAALSRLADVNCHLQGRLQQSPDYLLPHLEGLRVEAGALAAFVDGQLPPTCSHGVGGDGEEEAGEGGLWVHVAWALLSSTRLSAFLAHLPQPLHAAWWAALLSPCVLCAGGEEALTLPPIATDSASASSLPLPPSTRGLLSQSALLESASCRAFLLPALALVLRRLLEPEAGEGEEAAGRLQSRSGRRKRSRAAMEAEERKAESDASSAAPPRRLLSLLCLLTAVARLPLPVRCPSREAGQAEEALWSLLLRIARQSPQSGVVSSFAQHRVALLSRALLTDAVRALDQGEAAGEAALSSSLLPALASVEAWTDLVQPLSCDGQPMKGGETGGGGLEAPLLSSTERLLAAATTAALHSARASQTGRRFFGDDWPTALLTRLERGPDGAEADAPSPLQRLPRLCAARLLSASCAAALDAKNGTAAGTAVEASVGRRTLAALLRLRAECAADEGREASVLFLCALPLSQRLLDRPLLLALWQAGEGAEALLGALEERATDVAFRRLRSPSSSLHLPCAEWLLTRALRWIRSSRGSERWPALPPLEASADAKSAPASSRGVRQWATSLLRVSAALSSTAASSPSAASALGLVHRCFGLIARHCSRAEVEGDVVRVCLELCSSAASAHSGLRGLLLLFDCPLPRGRAPSPPVVLRCLRALAAVSAGRGSAEGQTSLLLLSVLRCIARQPQLYPLSLGDTAALLHCGLHCTQRPLESPDTAVALCHLLCALVDHRLVLLRGCVAVLLGLVRRALQSLAAVEAKGAGQGLRVAEAVSRVVVHLTADSAFARLLSHYLPYLLRDVLHLSRIPPSSAAFAVLHRWEAALQPAVAACLALLHEHDLSALHLTLHPSEKERFRQLVHAYKKSWQWKGE